MRRFTLWLPMLVWFLPQAGCKKPETACQKKCKGLLSCYEETRGKVPDAKASVSHCAKVCEGKGPKRYKAVVESFGTLECAAWMRRHRAEADFVVKKGKATAGRPGRARAAAVDPADHPFPKLQARPPKDPKERRNWRSPVQQRVDRIVITTARETVELKRVEAGKTAGDTGRWELAGADKGAADRFAVRNLLNRLERLHVQGRAEIAPGEFARYQLTEKLGVRCRVYAGSEVMADMVVGRADRAGAKGRGGVTTLIRRTQGNDVWRVTGSLTYLFKRPANGWRDASVIHFQREDVARLTIVLPTGKLVLKRNPDEPDARKKFTNWELVESEPKLASLDQNAITRLVSVLTHLRAAAFEKDATPETTGLDKPRATVEVQDKSGKTYTLLIGNRDPKRRSAYGQIKGDARVFRLRHPLDELADQPIASYRDKTLVQAELNQVVGLVVEKEGDVVEFARQGTQWKVVKPADLKFNLSRLISTIRLLEGRFAAHEFARETDPATTGLGKPEGRILVKVQPAADKPVKITEIIVGKAGPRGDYFAQVKGEREVVLIRRWVLTRVWQSAKDWAAAGAGARRQPRPGRQPFRGRQPMSSVR